MQSSLQDQFLNAARKKKIMLTFFLTNGFQFKATVKSFDSFTLLVESENKTQLLYKHAISTIVPSGDLGLSAGDSDGGMEL